MRILGMFFSLLISLSFARPMFVDVTDEVGLEDTHSSHIAWGDYNNDGYEDLLLGKRLFKNSGPPDFTFSEVTEEVGLGESPIRGGFFADYDNDGNLDIFGIAGKGSGEALYHNTGNGIFVDVTASAGPLTDDYPTEAAAWGDYDNDGFVDLFVQGNWEIVGGATVINFPDRLLRNRGDGTFEDVTEIAGVNPEPIHGGRSVVFGDYDSDGFQDIYVANYFSFFAPYVPPNRLFHNRGDGTFVDVAERLGVEGHRDSWDWTYGHSLAAEWVDFNNDTHLDLFVANLAHKDQQRSYTDDSYIFKNRGPEDSYHFTDIRETSGIPVHPVGSMRDGYYYDELHDGVSFADYDNDGDFDCYITQVYNIPFAYSFLYENNGDETFSDATEDVGTPRVWDAWGPAWSDFDCDGDLDLAVYGSSVYPIGSGDRRNHLYRNDGGNENNWLVVKLVGDVSNKAAIGGKVTAVVGTHKQLGHVEGSTGRGCQNSLPLEFGIGSAVSADTLYVEWPSGKKDTLLDVPANHYVTVNEKEEIGISYEKRWGQSSSRVLPQVYCYPNPFQDWLSISCTLPIVGDYKLSIHDISGRVVWRTQGSMGHPGRCFLSWGGRNRAGMRVVRGIYFVEIRAEDFSHTAKVVRLK